jgi:hypothetical protein
VSVSLHNPVAHNCLYTLTLSGCRLTDLRQSQAAAKDALRANGRAMRNHLGYMVNLALQDTPELRAHPAVSEFLRSGGLVQADRRTLADYAIVSTRAGRNDLLVATFDGAEVCLKKFRLANRAEQTAYLKEVQHVQSLCHPFIISYDTVFEEDGSMFLQVRTLSSPCSF